MKKLLLISLCFLPLSILGEVSSFNEVLRKDGLLPLREKTLNKNLQRLNEKKRFLEQAYQYVPDEKEILNVISKLWLVSNIKTLKWDKQLTHFINKQPKTSILYHSDQRLLNFVLPLKENFLIVLNSKYMKLLDLNEQEEKIMLDLLLDRFKQEFVARKVIHPFIVENMNKKSLVKKEYVLKSVSLLNKFIENNNFSLIDSKKISKFSDEHKEKDYFVRSLKTLLYKKSLVHRTLQL